MAQKTGSMEYGTAGDQDRSPALAGVTYRLGDPRTVRQIFLTINDRVGPAGRQPFEVFITTAEARQFGWLAALARVISALLRRGVDPAPLARELAEIRDPVGGRHAPDGRWIPSLAAEIGLCLEQHLRRCRTSAAASSVRQAG
ncbi:MAG: hypothetical protein HQL82_14840 [Magnetococcales bacterium]|nr:hypothetical protein [Magnetococcales bacterium]